MKVIPTNLILQRLRRLGFALPQTSRPYSVHSNRTMSSPPSAADIAAVAEGHTPAVVVVAEQVVVVVVAGNHLASAVGSIGVVVVGDDAAVGG